MAETTSRTNRKRRPFLRSSSFDVADKISTRKAYHSLRKVYSEGNCNDETEDKLYDPSSSPANGDLSDDHAYEVDVRTTFQDVLLVFQRLLSDSRIPDDCKADLKSAKELLVKEISGKSSAFRGNLLSRDSLDLSGQDPELLEMLAYQLRIKNNDMFTENRRKKSVHASSSPHKVYHLLFSDKIIEGYPECPVTYSQLSSWEFDVFHATDTGPDDVNKPSSLSGVPYVLAILNAHGIPHELGLDHKKLALYLHKVEDHYKPNHFHNRIHGLDVMQAAHALLVHSPRFLKYLNATEKFAMLLGAYVHDVSHPGVANGLIERLAAEPGGSKYPGLASIAVTHNNRSTLESFHVSTAFRLALEDENANPFLNMDQDKFQIFRTYMIELILATDMSRHVEMLDELKLCVSTDVPFDTFSDIETILNSPDKKLTIMKNVLHACDISNQSRVSKTSRKWSSMIMEEFWEQGELEDSLGYKCSPFRRAETPQTIMEATAKTQLFFIETFVMPLYKILSNYLPFFETTIIAYMKKNIEFWTTVVTLISSNESKIPHNKDDGEVDHVDTFVPESVASRRRSDTTLLSVSLSNLSKANCMELPSRTTLVDVLLDLDNDSKAPKTRRLTIDETYDEYEPLPCIDLEGSGDGATSGIGTMSSDSASSKNDNSSLCSSFDSSFDVHISNILAVKSSETKTIKHHLHVTELYWLIMKHHSPSFSQDFHKRLCNNLCKTDIFPQEPHIYFRGGNQPF
eukprot:UC4_evm2s114